MRTKGFTLIEVLVVLAIVGILATIAMPSYGRHIQRSKLITAQSDLEVLALRLENRYQRLLSYPGTGHATTAALQTEVGGWVPASESADFVFSSENASASTYTIKATAASGVIAGCVIALTHAGTRSLGNCDGFSSDGRWL